VARARAARKGEGSGRHRGEMTRGGVLQLEVALGWSVPAVSGGDRATQRGKRRGQRRKKQRAVRRTSSQFPKSSGTPL
jgi:hypothetical protein